jgi:GTP-binding protein
LPQLRGAPLITVSGVTGQGLDRLHATRCGRLAGVERAGADGAAQPLAGGDGGGPSAAGAGRAADPAALYHPGADAAARFRRDVLATRCDLPEAYNRYLINGLRADFDLPGTPIRLFLRSQAEANPYRNRKKKTPSRLTKHLRK